MVPSILWAVKCTWIAWEDWLPGLDGKGWGIGAVHDDTYSTLKEVNLAILWCAGAAYFSFRFTDSLMTRWLVHYTPLATLIRLICICGVNYYFIKGVHFVLGVNGDSRLLLPAWVLISIVLGVSFQIVRVNISDYRELSTNTKVFSLLCFVSMVVLLHDVHARRPKPPWRELQNFITNGTAETKSKYLMSWVGLDDANGEL